MISIPELAALSVAAKAFFINLLVAFGIAGFIVALSLIAKVGLRK